jgi:hypothetical protein
LREGVKSGALRRRKPRRSCLHLLLVGPVTQHCCQFSRDEAPAHEPLVASLRLVTILIRDGFVFGAHLRALCKGECAEGCQENEKTGITQKTTAHTNAHKFVRMGTRREQPVSYSIWRVELVVNAKW